jgi:hypothetical protein
LPVTEKRNYVSGVAQETASLANPVASAAELVGHICDDFFGVNGGVDPHCEILADQRRALASSGRCRPDGEVDAGQPFAGIQAFQDGE